MSVRSILCRSCLPWDRAVRVVRVLVIPAVALLVLQLRIQTRAQTSEESWTSPINLSRSGAASAPLVLPQPDGEARVVWWDSLDGLMLVERTVGEWSDPVQTPLFEPEPTDQPAAGGESRPTPLGAMPHIIGAADGGAYALWLGAPERNTGATPLLLARLPAGATSWSDARAIAESAVSFALTEGGDSTLYLAYARNIHTEASPSGIYVRRSSNGGTTWTAAEIVHDSLYYRVASAEELALRMTANAEDQAAVTWNDPQRRIALHALSADGGDSWSDALQVGSDEAPAVNARAIMPSSESIDRPLLLWEGTSSLGGCALYQAWADDVAAGRYAGASRVLEGLNGCPSIAEERLLLDADELILLNGRGTETLTLSAFDGDEWSEPKRLSFRFTDPDTETTVYLNGLDAALVRAIADEEEEEAEEAEEAGEEPPSSAGAPATTLIVVGVDADGDVWSTESRLEALDLVYAPPAAWSLPQALLQSAAQPDLAALAVDPEGTVHALWAEPASASETVKVLRYARWGGNGWTRATTVLRSAEGSAVEPSIAATEERLHAVWSDGPNGQVLYSRAFLRDAQAAGGWDEPLPLPGPTAERDVGSRPQILAVAADGPLHAIYAVPLNEERGIYTTSSEDGGVTWSHAAQVFDAAGAGWAALDGPRLAVDAVGGLHAVWVRTALSPDAPSLGVYYATSSDGGRTWSEPDRIAEGDFGCADAVADAVGGITLLWSQASRTRSWWHQWTPGAWDVGPESPTWSRAARIPGFSNVDCPLGVVDDGALAVQVIGLGLDSAGERALLHQTWTLSLEPAAEGDATGARIEGRWGELETFRPDPVPSLGGVSTVLQPDTGQMDVVYRAEIAVGDDDTQPGLWHTSRTVTVTALSPEARPQIVLGPDAPPTATPEVTDEPETEAPPSQTGLAADPPPLTEAASGTTQSIIISAGIAAVIVGGAFGTRLLLKRQS